MNKHTKKEWTSPGSHCKLLELDEAKIRWYSNNKSLTISGKASDDIKSQLRSNRSNRRRKQPTVKTP